MKNICIRHSPVEGDFDEVLVISKIARLSKESQDVTLIHLDNKEIIRSLDSMNTLEARINSAARD